MPSIHVNRAINQVASTKIAHEVIRKNVFKKQKQMTINTMSFQNFNDIVAPIISKVKKQSIPFQVNEIYNCQRNLNVILRKDKTRQ